MERSEVYRKFWNDLFADFNDDGYEDVRDEILGIVEYNLGEPDMREAVFMGFDLGYRVAAERFLMNLADLEKEIAR